MRELYPTQEGGRDLSRERQQKETRREDERGPRVLDNTRAKITGEGRRESDHPCWKEHRKRRGKSQGRKGAGR